MGISLGQAFAKAIGDKADITHYGTFLLPLDETLSHVVIDFSGRPGLEFNVPFTRARVGDFDVDLSIKFFQVLSWFCEPCWSDFDAGVTLHIDNLRGINVHHQIATVFKAFGRALRMALAVGQRASGSIPSTKARL